MNTWISQINTEYKLAMSVDCVIFGYTAADLYVALIRCNFPPYEGELSLAGDLLKSNEDLDEAANRILWERVGLRNVYVEQVQCFGKLDRHPLGRVVTVAYYSLIKIDDYLKVVSNDCPLIWKKVDEVGQLAFDHNEIFDLCLAKLRRQLKEHPVGFSLLPKKFTLNQLQQLYEVILNISFDKRNFRRKLKALDAIKDEGEVEKDVRHRPAKLYSFDIEKYEASPKSGFLVT
ncbi:MAG: NUDIX hydrolase [Saprospiraceae bacterium]|nr:NUDIX hydrolase [Saprospiraceae bacterium]